ncbi:ABC transporter permease [Sulfurovum sp.]|uniref:FtsX-like permease family protein n=1 Tax=Sulfurovum sp. TaxID=1969726 RepID=UPI0025E7BE81|nr:ABC transporter permease [Sulfurovum sp.]
MFEVAVKMLMHDRTKFLGLFTGIGFTAFLVTFAMSYFAGFMTRGFALVSENPTASIWVMDPAVHSTEATINMSDGALGLVRSVKGVSYAVPLYLGDVTARFPNGHFQSFQMIGVDDGTLSGTPRPGGGLSTTLLHIPQSVIVDSGGTKDKLQTPMYTKDMWPYDGVHLNVPTRKLRYGDTLIINDKRVVVSGVSSTIPRFPPRPLMYTTQSNFKRLNPGENRYITFIMAKAEKNISAADLARNITKQTGLKAVTNNAFKKETVLWYLKNSEDVGDMVNMVILAMLVGFGVTGVMLYMFTYENLRQYAVLKAMGASNNQLVTMVFTQAFIGVIVGSGIGIGICALLGESVASADFPFRMMWFAPLLGFFGVWIVSITAALISVRPVLSMEPGIVFSQR